MANAREALAELLDKADKDTRDIISPYLDGIDENRLKPLSTNKVAHSITVAQTMERLATTAQWNKDDIAQMAALGLVHDIGYLKQTTRHARAGAEMLKAAGYPFAYEVSRHGRASAHPSCALVMLWYADLTCDNKGLRVTLAKRLSNVQAHYGVASTQSLNAGELVRWLRTNMPLKLRGQGPHDEYDHEKGSKTCRHA